MSSASYSFLDVAVLEEVRERFAAGDALAILSLDLDHLIWANGAGARLFGFGDIEKAIGGASGLAFAAKRQISAARGFPAIGRDRSIAMRMGSRGLSLLASVVVLPDGEEAILLALPAASATAAQAVSGFSEAGHFVALLDENGGIEAASDGFSELGIDRTMLATLVEASAAAPGRIVKRMLPASNGLVPAGLARLIDSPARHFLVVVDDGQVNEEPNASFEPPAVEVLERAESGVAEPEPNAPAEAAADNGETTEPEALVAIVGEAEPDAYFESPEVEGLEQAEGGTGVAEPEPPTPAETAADDGEPAEPEADVAIASDDVPPEAYFTPPEIAELEEAQAGTGIEEPETDASALAIEPAEPADTSGSEASPAQPVSAPAVERSTQPAKFVWRTDADGRFSHISPEFAKAVGNAAANVVGKSFAEVSDALGLDPSGEIDGLLARRDTWSGRSVLWPVAGTDLRIPVDLAALPVYNRSRSFEGFRGFGVARAGDAVADPAATGLAIEQTDGTDRVNEAPQADNDSVDPFQGEVPALEIEPVPDRRFTDKIIRLAEHRQPANDIGLSNGERIAFQQIGERLKEATDVADEPAVASFAPEAAADAPELAVPIPDASIGEAGSLKDALSSLDTNASFNAPADVFAAEPTGYYQSTAEEIFSRLVEPRQIEHAEGYTVASSPESDAKKPIDSQAVPDGSDAPLEIVDSADVSVEPSAATEPADDGERDDVSDLLSLDGADDESNLFSGSQAAPVATEGTGRSATGGQKFIYELGSKTGDAQAAGGQPDRSPAIGEGSAGGGGGGEQTSAANSQAQSELPLTAAVLANDPAASEEKIAPVAEPMLDLPVDPPQPKRPARRGMSLLGLAGWDETNAAPSEPKPDDALADPVVPFAESAASEEIADQIDQQAEAVGADQPADDRTDISTLDPIEHEAATAEIEAASEQADPTLGTDPDVADEPEPQLADRVAEPNYGLGLLEKLPVPVLVHSGDTLHYANAEFLNFTGYDTIEKLDEAGGIGALFADSFDDDQDEGADDRQLRLRRADGEEFPVEAFLQSVPWDGGKALMLVLSRLGEKVSGQSPLIAELEARVAEMRTIIDTATDGVVLISRDGTIRSISRPAEALFGFDSDDVAGKPFVSLFAIESQRSARDYLSGLSDNGVASVLNDGREVIGRESEGRFIPLFMTIGKLPNDSGFCAVVRDITQWKRAEEDLTQARAAAERASSQKSDFLARISHEIRTPLNAIIGFSELMVDEKFGPVANDRYRDYLRDINRSGNHVLDLVNDLLDISKIEAGQQEMAYEAVSLNDTLAETVAMMQPQANRERVIIRSSFGSKLPDVVADLRSVRQIALNILSNAIRYTQAGGQVIISTAYEASGDIVMRVRDTGIGMTQPEIEQALKPFKQINSLKRPRGDGTGLGLPLTKALVEANRAKFVINSTPGEGTLVEVSFPSTRVLAD